MIKAKICHITTVHNRYDTRIFVKECQSLVDFGYDVYLIVADGNGDEIIDGVKILDIGKPKSRLKRILFFRTIALQKAVALKADIYHFHDPELLKIGRKLRKRKKTVIYDSHEDVPRQVLDKAYIPPFIRKIISNLIERYEDSTVSKLSGVITVTPNLEARFLKNNSKVVQICNFPKIKELESHDNEIVEKENAVCYVGAISKVRGILNMVGAMQFADDTKFLLGGKFENEELRIQAIANKGWNSVVELGFLSRNGVKTTLQKSIAGLVVLEPTQSYLDSIPVKMFEYMISGIPVIASDFPYWRELIEHVECAYFVNPKNPKEIGKAIKYLVHNKDESKAMGERGRKAVYEKFNWSIEEKKLLKFYSMFLEKSI